MARQWTSAGVVCVVLAAACSAKSSAPTTTSVIAPTTAVATTILQAPTTTAASTTTDARSDWLPPQVCTDCEDETVASIPVGENGVTYLHVGTHEAEPVGPGAMVVGDDGAIYVLDTGGIGLFRVADGVTTPIELNWDGIDSLLDVAVIDDEMWILNSSPMGAEQIAHVSIDGETISVTQLPRGFLQADGMTGLAQGPQGELWLEFLFGELGVATFPPDAPDSQRHQGYPYPNGLYRPVYDAIPDTEVEFYAGDLELAFATEGSLLSVRLMGVNPDDSFVVEVAEGFEDEMGLHFDHRAVWVGSDGNLIGIAHMPSTADQFIFVENPFHLGPDGRVYYLLTENDRVVVQRLSWRPPE